MNLIKLFLFHHEKVDYNKELKECKEWEQKQEK